MFMRRPPAHLDWRAILSAADDMQERVWRLYCAGTEDSHIHSSELAARMGFGTCDFAVCQQCSFCPDGPPEPEHTNV